MVDLAPPGVVKMSEQLNPSHYNGWLVGDFILSMDLDFFLGNAVKYLSRYRFKNGLEDLRKCRTYLLRVSDLPSDWREFKFKEHDLLMVDDLARILNLPPLVKEVIALICTYAQNGDPALLKNAVNRSQNLITTYGTDNE